MSLMNVKFLIKFFQNKNYMNHALVQSSNLTWDMFQTVATPSGVSTLEPWKIMFISCPAKRLLNLRQVRG